MTWTHNSITGGDRHDIVRAIESIVTDTVTDFRNRGHRTDHAAEQAALALGISKRRVKSFLYGEAFSATRDEFARIQVAFLRHLDAQADHLAARSEAARARRRQMTLGV